MRLDQPSDDLRHQQSLLYLSLRDRRKARNMLDWPHIEESSANTDWRRELQVMLVLGYKAEIQLVESQPGGMVAWIMDRMLTVRPSTFN